MLDRSIVDGFYKPTTLRHPGLDVEFSQGAPFC